MLYVRLTIRVKVGIPESLGWYSHKITGSNHLKTLRQLFQMKFMRNEYKIFLLESIVLSVIFTACCSSGSNRFHQEVWACRLKTVSARGYPYI